MVNEIKNKFIDIFLLVVIVSVALALMVKILFMSEEYLIPQKWFKFMFYSFAYIAGATYCSVLSLKGKQKTIPIYLLLFFIEVIVVTVSFLIFYFNYLPLPERSPEIWTIAIIFFMGFTVVVIHYLSEKLLTKKKKKQKAETGSYL